MPYFEVFNRMFVHFHLYTTHEAVHGMVWYGNGNFLFDIVHNIIESILTKHID